jgi:hypothetical protein
MKLYHGTAYPSPQGLIPAWNQTCVYFSMARNPDAAIRDRAKQEQGEYVFASSERSSAIAYAFKISNKSSVMRGTSEAFAEGTHRTGRITFPDSSFVIAFVVGKPNAYACAVEKATPTLYAIEDTRAFCNIRRSDGLPTDEWVSKRPIAASALQATHLTLQDLAAQNTQVFAYGRMNNMHAAANLRTRSIAMLLHHRLIRPVNAELGLPPNIPARRILEVSSAFQPRVA